MILSEIKNVSKIYLITERDFVVDFFKRVVRVSNSVLADPFLPKAGLSSNVLVVIDAFILESSSDVFFDNIEECKYPILCLEPPVLSERSRCFIEKNFRYVIPFPADGDLFVKYFFDSVEKIEKDYPEMHFSEGDGDYHSYYDSCNSECNKRNSPDKNDKSDLEKDLFGLFVGESNIMYSVRNKIKKIALSDAPVLLLGETGTGKSTGANIIHKLSKRNKKEMKSLNISTIDESVACSTFFGTTLGAFTDALDKKGLFTIADKGTLFLDEIGIASPTVQSMLLTVVETGMFRKVGSERFEKSDVRLLFATNANLGEMVKNGTFRKDFFCRICGNAINFPALRNRKEDIPCIIKSHICGKKKVFSDSALDKLMEYDWPGNIRELHQCLDRALLYSSRDVIEADDIDFGLFCL